MSTDGYAEPLLSWSKSDIEQSIGFRGGKYTRTNNLLTFLIGALLTAIFFGAAMPFDGSAFTSMFTQRGPTPYVVVFLFFWALAILALKWRKLAFQKQVFKLELIPDEHDFVLSPSTASKLIDHIHMVVDNPGHFILLNRIVVALANLKNIGRVADVDDILRAQAEHEESSLETSYSLIQGFIWAIPVLGFIGTVLGLSSAIGGFGGVLSEAGSGDMEQITTALKSVTAGLATAFETTLVALVAALLLQLIVVFQKKSEEEFLDACTDFCVKRIVGRLRVSST